MKILFQSYIKETIVDQVITKLKISGVVQKI